MRMTGAVATITLAAVGLVGCVSGPAVDYEEPAQHEGSLPEETITELQGLVELTMAASGAPGAVVGVWVPWSGTWVTALGTDAEGTELTADAVFRAGGTTRMMTCDVLYLLEAEGKLSVSDPVTDYVEGYPELEDITLGQLCDGTSGLGSSSDVLAGALATNPARQWHPLEYASHGIGRRSATAPGTAHDGSDAGYYLLGIALQQVTGKRLPEMLDDYVFSQLELDHTALPSPAPGEPGPAGTSMRGYVSLKGEDGILQCDAPTDVTVRSASQGGAHSGVVSTVEDLGAYLRASGAGAFDGKEDSGRWAEPVPAGASAPAWYTAKGGAVQAGPLRGAFGSLPGYNVAGFVDPKTGLTIVVALNSSTNGRSAVYLAWAMAAVLANVPTADGSASEFGVPWSVDDYRNTLISGAACPLPEGVG